jgi:hypothetical protein
VVNNSSVTKGGSYHRVTDPQGQRPGEFQQPPRPTQVNRSARGILMYSERYGDGDRIRKYRRECSPFKP